MELLGFRCLSSFTFAVVVEFVELMPIFAFLLRQQSTSHARNPVTVFHLLHPSTSLACLVFSENGYRKLL